MLKTQLFPWVAAVGLSLFAGLASAQDKFAPVREQIATCTACHGEQGVPQTTQFPILAGQHFYYLYVQLKDYKSGFRANPIMQPIASKLEKKEMQLIAEYFSTKAWPKEPALKADPSVVGTAKSVITAGQCVACHLSGFEGNSRVPYVAGQNYDYLLNTMKQFKSKERANSPSKGSLMASFSDEEIEAVTKYLSSLNSSK